MRINVGANPDLIDRDGDRWYEVTGGRYQMDVRGEQPGEDPPAEPVLRATIERNAGPCIEVYRLVDRGPVR